MTINEIQLEHVYWISHNFPDNGEQEAFMGIVEEVGELSHALLKQRQNIRGDPFELEEAAKDAIGDMMIFTVFLCNERGWNLEDIVSDTWMQVRERDWVLFPFDGLTK